MCGIVGSIGTNKSTNIVLEGLNRLEYRGYDSCGISLLDEKIEIIKSVNRVSDLTEHVTKQTNIAIGHTRWATHGGVNLENAHPHLSHDEKMTLVHNGVIENFVELKETYCADITFTSQTDSEVILEVINYFYKKTNDMNQAIIKFMEVTRGSYGLVIYHSDMPDCLFAVKNKSPLLLGKCEGFYTFSSDPSAVIDLTNIFYQFEDKHFCIINQQQNSCQLFNANNEQVEIKFETVKMQYTKMSTENYDTYMLKEIEEQPKALRNIIDHYQSSTFDPKLLTTLKDASHIFIVACGTSYNAGLACKQNIEEKLNIRSSVEIASEFGYAKTIIPDNSFFIFLSQSGETADSMLVFNKVKNKYPILAITNVSGSQMDRNADFSLLLYAGMEVAVASTKAYTCQIAVLNILISSVINDTTIFEALEKVIIAQNKVIMEKEIFNSIAAQIKDEEHIFTLGRLTDFALAQEAALKLKEISYINNNAWASGELKHGTISLIQPGSKVISIITDPTISENSRSNVHEVLARGARVFTFSTTDTQANDDAYVVDFVDTHNIASLVAILPHQYLAYYTTKLLGHDVDKPRNLAKSVTVE